MNSTNSKTVQMSVSNIKAQLELALENFLRATRVIPPGKEIEEIVSIFGDQHGTDPLVPITIKYKNSREVKTRRLNG